jgi:hypothetical protein
MFRRGFPLQQSKIHGSIVRDKPAGINWRNFLDEGGQV